jgi:tryptophan synthase alpha chain
MKLNSSKLGLYTVVGFPDKHASNEILSIISNCGDIGFIELGFPYSDPVADGPIIQKAHAKSLENGTKLKDLFDSANLITEIVKNRTEKKDIIAMGYINPILQYGLKKFLENAKLSGIDYLIIPDMPLEAYRLHYKETFEAASISPIFLVAPNSSDERIKEIDLASNGYIYAISGLSITGISINSNHLERQKYISRLKSLKLQNKVIFGFGIKDKQDVNQIISEGFYPVIGSAFIQNLEITSDYKSNVNNFLKEVL